MSKLHTRSSRQETTPDEETSTPPTAAASSPALLLHASASQPHTCYPLSTRTVGPHTIFSSTSEVFLRVEPEPVPAAGGLPCAFGSLLYLLHVGKRRPATQPSPPSERSPLWSPLPGGHLFPSGAPLPSSTPGMWRSAIYSLFQE